MSSQGRGDFSVTIYLPDGKPDGLRVIGKEPGYGVCIVQFPFSELKNARKERLKRPGVYVLLGESEDVEAPIAYVGLADSLAKRLPHHLKDEDEGLLRNGEAWTRVVVFTSKSVVLHKTRILYLEAELIRLAKASGRCASRNRQDPNLPTIRESDRATMVAFLEEIRQVCGVIGVKVFEKPAGRPPSERLLYIKAPKKGIEAQGYEAGEEFIVLAGSRGAAETAPGAVDTKLDRDRKRLKNDRILVPEGESLVLKQDYAFGSPSAAAGVMLGREANGLREWKDESGRSLKEIREQEAGGAA